jgi:hypothetical protein
MYALMRTSVKKNIFTKVVDNDVGVRSNAYRQQRR